MFGFKKKAQAAPEFVATQNGSAVALSDVPDEAFAQKMLGDGVAVLPSDGRVVSPVSGKVIDVTDTLHAYCIQTPDGLDVLVHVGINTVELKGEGFQAHVKTGDTVSAGDPLVDVDLALLSSRGYPLYTPTIITNIDEVKSFRVSTGDVKAGETIVLSYEK